MDNNTNTKPDNKINDTRTNNTSTTEENKDQKIESKTQTVDTSNQANTSAPSTSSITTSTEKKADTSQSTTSTGNINTPVTSNTNNTKDCKIRFISKGIIYFEINKDYTLQIPLPKDFDENNKTVKISYTSDIGKPNFSYSIAK